MEQTWKTWFKPFPIMICKAFLDLTKLPLKCNILKKRCFFFWKSDAFLKFFLSLNMTNFIIFFTWFQYSISKCLKSIIPNSVRKCIVYSESRGPARCGSYQSDCPHVQVSNSAVSSQIPFYNPRCFHTGHWKIDQPIDCNFARIHFH